MKNQIKRYYYVAIMIRGNLYFVTSLTAENKVAWERCEKPHDFITLEEATRVSDGLIKTGHTSFVVQAIAPLDYGRKINNE